jgi:fructosamine-3-kinase
MKLQTKIETENRKTGCNFLPTFTIMNTREQFIGHLDMRFSDFFGAETKILQEEPVSGGDINQCHLLRTTRGDFFMKTNGSIFGLDFFEKEAQGLVALADAGVIKVPRPLFDGKFHQQVFLVMEFLPGGAPSASFWQDFGNAMAALHRHSRESFGFGHTNYIGRLHQRNEPHASWAEFYAEERILPLTAKALERGLLHAHEAELAEALCSRLGSLIPAERPALLHGDLWKGNFMSISDGSPAIFDPSVYYGHREMDLAMTLLFGGFEREFYETYESAFPLHPGWRERTELFQLYPLLVHLLLFGGHYRADVCRILGKFA